MKQNTTNNSPICSSLILLLTKDKKVIFLQEEQEVICFSFVLWKDPVSHPGKTEKHISMSVTLEEFLGRMSEKPVSIRNCYLSSLRLRIFCRKLKIKFMRSSKGINAEKLVLFENLGRSCFWILLA